jgi:putative chitinase
MALAPLTPLQIIQKKAGVKPDNKLTPSTLIALAKYFKLTKEQAAHFFAQTSHESAGFTVFFEDLNYSASGLKKTFSKYFPKGDYDAYARQPVKIANRVYGDRMDNGPEKTGDGWKYRGRGVLQLTGKSNYKAFEDYLNFKTTKVAKNPLQIPSITTSPTPPVLSQLKVNILQNPDLVASEWAFESAIFYFDKNNLWPITKKGVNDDTILQLTKLINGGTNGLEDRKTKTYQYYNLLKQSKF